MDIKDLKIGFIGAGNMASAMLDGVIKNNVVIPRNIYVYDVDIDKRDQLSKKLGITPANNNTDIVSKCEMLLLAVKPMFISQILEEIKNKLTEKHVIISIAAGISTQYIRDIIEGRCDVIRAMPNTPALVGEGMTAVCRNKDISDEVIMQVCKLFEAFGQVEQVDEKYMDAITAVSGSSPAYVFMFIEALADGGVLMGLPRELSYKMAAQAVLGSAKMVLDTKMHPGSLKDMVCSPGGTTIEAVHVLEKSGFRAGVMDAVKACSEKGTRMGKE